MTNITPHQIACPTVGPLPTPGFLDAPSLLVRRRTIATQLRNIGLAVWRLLPSLSASTPSDEAMSMLTPGDRLGERR